MLGSDVVTGRSRIIFMEPIDHGRPAGPVSAPADVLIVEDDLIIALDLEETILRFGVRSSRTAMNVAQALEMIMQRTPDFALLDVGLRDETSLAVADRLAALGVPFAFLTGYGARAMPLPRFADRPKIEKPFAPPELEAVLRNWRAR